jgi:hypothetical protein
MLRTWFTRLASGVVLAIALIGAATPAMAAEGNQGNGQQGKSPLFRAVMRELTDQTGMDRCAVLADLADGQTFSQIAQANGSNAQKVMDAVLANLKERLAKAVSNNKITQEKADEVYKNMSERLTTLMDADIHEQISKLYKRVCGNNS